MIWLMGIPSLTQTELRLENEVLRRHLLEITEAARHNEEKMHRYQTHELRLLAATSLAELVHTLLDDTRSVMRLDWVTLTLVDPEHELRRLLEDQGLESDSENSIRFLDNCRVLDKLFRFGRQPRLGPYDVESHGEMFRLGTNTRQAWRCCPCSEMAN